MRKSNGVVSLVLVGTMAVFFGFKSCVESNDDDYPTTQSSSGHSGSGVHFWSHSSGGSSSGGHSFGTSRGGFGSSGHSAGA